MAIFEKFTRFLPQINEKNRNYVVGGILLLIFAVYYGLVLHPQLSALRTLNPEILVLKGDLAKARDDIQKVNLYQTQVKELEEKIQRLNTQVRSKEDVHAILERISLLANKNRIRIEQIVPVFDHQELLHSGQEGKYYSLPITIEAKAGYHDFGRFLNQIENDIVSLQVDRFSIMANGQDTLRHSLKLTLRATILEAASAIK